MDRYPRHAPIYPLQHYMPLFDVSALGTRIVTAFMFFRARAHLHRLPRSGGIAGCSIDAFGNVVDQGGAVRAQSAALRRGQPV